MCLLLAVVSLIQRGTGFKRAGKASASAVAPGTGTSLLRWVNVDCKAVEAITPGEGQEQVGVQGNYRNILLSASH